MLHRPTRREWLALAAAPFLPAAAVVSPYFENVTAAAGIRWKHDNAMSPERYMPEAIGPGAAIFDYDDDGWMDLYLVNSGPTDFWQPKQPVRNALYKNNRDGTFTDVTEQAGVAGANGVFGMGAAAADYDNDGWTDLLVTAYGRPILYHNNGDGTFTDVSAKAGLTPEKLGTDWTTSAVWFDYDNDGKLDLFLCSYVDFGRGKHTSCGDNRLGRNYYCVPRAFNPTSSLLLHNNGDGTFRVVSRGTNIERSKGKALGVVASDFNGDGRMDLFVSNDTMQNFLLMNRGGGRWEEIGLAAEVAYGENGQARSGMGVDAGDFDGDGLPDLFVTNIDQEMYSLYRNSGNETFVDIAHKQGVAQATRQMSGWGVRLADFDNDGLLDLLIVNAHPDDMIEQYSEQIKYREPLLLFRNVGGSLKNVSKEAGPAFQQAYSARGLALGDFWNRGRLDAVVGVNGGAPLLLKNGMGEGNHWLGLALQGRTCNREAIGARVVVTVAGKKRTILKGSGGGFLSSHDPRMIIGLGSAEKAEALEIHWPAPSKSVDRLVNVAGGQYLKLVEGK